MIHKKEWVKKVTHGYHKTQIEGQDEIDTKETNNWLNLHLTSHLEGFVCAIQEQEIDTKSFEEKQKERPGEEKENG